MSTTIHPTPPEFRSQALATDQASQNPSTDPGSDLDAAGAVPGHSEADAAAADDLFDPIQDAIDAGLTLEEVMRVAGSHAR